VVVSAVTAHAAQTAAELELQLARTPHLYLVVDLCAATLEVKARGVVLDRMNLNQVEIEATQPVVGRRCWPELALPQLWRVSQPPEATWRRLVEPTELRQYNDRESEPPAVTAAQDVVELPAHFACEVDTGWQVVVGQRVGGGWWRRLAAAAADSWRRWRGRAPVPAPPRLVLETAPDDARRLVHLFQVNLPILLVARPPETPESGGLS